MTIDRDELINLLVEKTGMNRVEVEKQLDELISRIMDAANRGKALEIKGFGLFYFDEGGELTFRASDQLDSEINFTHAGMEPIEVKPPKSAASTPPKELPVEKDEEDTLPVKKDDADKPVKQEDTADIDDVYGIGKTLASQSDDDDEESEQSEPFGKLFQEEPAGVKPEPKPKEKISKAGTAPAKKDGSGTEAKKKTAAKSRDPMSVIIVVVLAGVFLFAAYFVFTEFLDPPEQPEMSQQQDIEPEDPPATAERDVTEATEPEEPQPDQVPAPENEPEPLDDPIDEVTTTDPYGLYGEIAETDGDVFTIVVHSLRDRDIAEQTADELRADGFRINVTERIVDGQTYFRVGIGQFPSISEAQQEATTLPDPYNNQNFIHRLQ